MQGERGGWAQDQPAGSIIGGNLFISEGGLGDRKLLRARYDAVSL